MYNKVKGGRFMINILICDDDISIIKQVDLLLHKIEAKYKIEFNIESTSNGDSIINSNKTYDITIIDVEMPGINGLKLSEKLKQRNSDVLIIIITSFSAYLDKAMDINVFRYLSKPIDKERFCRNFLDAIKRYKQISKQIIINSTEQVDTIKTKDILYIEKTKHGSIIFTKTNKHKTNKKPEEWLTIINQPNCFAYSHSSFIVNLQNVINFDKTYISFECNDKTKTVACISQRKYLSFKKSFFDFAGGLK